MTRKLFCVIMSLCSFASATENNPSILPSSNPNAPKGSGLFVFTEWLYWQANETGLSYAINNPDFDLLDDTITGSGHTAQPKFDWHSGIRLGLGYNIPHDDWDVEFVWTWYEDQANNNQSSPGESPTIFPLFVHPNLYNSDLS